MIAIASFTYLTAEPGGASGAASDMATTRCSSAIACSSALFSGASRRPPDVPRLYASGCRANLPSGERGPGDDDIVTGRPQHRACAPDIRGMGAGLVLRVAGADWRPGRVYFLTLLELPRGDNRTLALRQVGQPVQPQVN